MSCSYDSASHTATVAIAPGARFSTSLGVTAGVIYTANFEPPATGAATPCGTATPTNTDTIVVHNTSATTALRGGLNLLGLLGPGFTDEPGNSDEIEMQVDFGLGGTLFYDPYRSSSAGADIALGGTQVNLNAAEVDGVDADVTFSGSAYVLLLPGRAPDLIDGQGGSGTPTTPFRFPIEVPPGGNGIGGAGGTSPDRLTGGNGNDHLTGDRGPDRIIGEGGRDTLDGDRGNDRLDGGRGVDHLLGGAGRDRLFGRSGNDTLLGLGGHDFLNAGQGRRDTCARSRVDVLIGCELDF